MPRLASLTALLAIIVPTIATLSDGQYTETIGAQEVGSTIIGGTMVYSMNYCSIIHSTRCYTSLSSGGPAPTSSPPVPTYGQSISSGASVSIPTPSTVSSGGTVENPPSTTPVVSSESVPGGEHTGTTGTEGGGSSTTRIPDVPTGAAVMGAPAVMGNVVMAALAALVV
ncbi:hypothetical protein IF1G_04123 [Cordyceps javanica]|uniref:GPI anchored serine-rich protein n=1 Tax=Cordyceps javanica TaxID=43265 RepID=A0A545W2G6_9HYPO|nr:hypothetical protein IF1G_04123 [Cordyceps javanica]TQW08144.1 hypothetical protein IF2G_04020 [Cordyceps javanica]